MSAETGEDVAVAAEAPSAAGVWGRVRPIPAIAVAVGFAILVGLGVWQVVRLQWKERLLARIAELQTAPPEPLSVVLNRLQDQSGPKNRPEVDFVRVQMLCPSLQQTPTLRLYAVLDDQMGDRLITACPISAGPYRSILVDRGFVPREQVDQVRPGPVIDAPVVGVLRQVDKAPFALANNPAQNDWHTRDIPAMARALNAPDPAPVFLMLERPAPEGFGPKPAPLPTNIPNNHLGYAITWFGLAIALVGVYIASLRAEPRKQA